MVAHYGHMGVGRFVDWGERYVGGSHQVCSQVYKNTVARGWSGGIPLEKFVKIRCLTIVSENVFEPKMLFL